MNTIIFLKQMICFGYNIKYNITQKAPKKYLFNNQHIGSCTCLTLSTVYSQIFMRKHSIKVKQRHKDFQNFGHMMTNKDMRPSKNMTISISAQWLEQMISLQVFTSYHMVFQMIFKESTEKITRNILVKTFNSAAGFSPVFHILQMKSIII